MDEAKTKKKFFIILEEISSGKYKNQSLNFSLNPYDESMDGERVDDSKILLLCEVLKQTQHITDVNLCSNGISDIGALSLSNVDTIKALNLSHNYLSTNTIKSLASGILNKLVLDYCIYAPNFSLDALTLMMSAFETNETITSLSIINWQLPDHLLSSFIEKNTTVKHLVLGGDISDNALSHVGNNNSLEELTIIQSQLSYNAIYYISQNTSIRSLYIDHSLINDQAIDLFASCFTLRQLTLFNSNISFDGARTLLNNSHLTYFVISSSKDQKMSSIEKWNKINEEFKNICKQRLEQDANTESYDIEYKKTDYVTDHNLDGEIKDLIGDSEW